MCLTRVELHWLSLGSCLWCLRTYSASIRRHPSPPLIWSDHHHPPTPTNSDSRSPPARLPPSPTIHLHLYASGLTLLLSRFSIRELGDTSKQPLRRSLSSPRSSTAVHYFYMLVVLRKSPSLRHHPNPSVERGSGKGQWRDPLQDHFLTIVHVYL